MIAMAAGCLLPIGTACTGDNYSIYARRLAYLRVSPVNTAAPLFSALNNPGQWCAVTYDATHYRFASPTATASLSRTALDAYGLPRSIAGMLIGTPSLPEVDGSHQPRAYDLACPSCYESAYIERALQLSTTTPDQAHCARCGRDYNLATGAPLNAPDRQVQAPLYRYRLQYGAAQGVLIVQN